MNRALLLQRVWSHSPKELATSQQHTRRPASLTQSTSRFLPPQLLILLAMVSLQLGAAFAKSLFPVVGSTGTVFLRLAFAAIVLMLMWRPRLRGYTRKDYLAVVLFGVTMAGLNGFFYAALARLPLGIVVTLEFVGPLSIALFSSRRKIDVFWALFAVAGIILLAPINGATVDPLGVVLALTAGAFWAAYILLNVRVGQAFPGGTGLALGMSIGALVTLPFGVTSLPVIWHDPSILLIGLGVAVLSSVIPFSLEMEALRRISARVFGVLMSLDPVMAALIGLVVLGETVGLRALLAMALIVIASSGVSFGGKASNHPIQHDSQIDRP